MPNSIRKLILISLFLFSATFAETELCGRKLSPLSLTKANSPYLLTSDLVVPIGSRLTIEPGVEIIVAPSATSKCKDDITQEDWADSQFVSIKVRGTLYIHGTKALPVRIHPKDAATKVSWDGIRIVKATPSTTEIRFLDIQGAQKALLIKESEFVVENSWFTNNNTAIWLGSEANVQIRNSLFALNRSSGVYVHQSAPLLTANIFYENQTYAIWADTRKGLELKSNMFWKSGEEHCYHCLVGTLKKTGVNSGGDSVDAKGNVMANPVFIGSKAESEKLAKDPKIPTPTQQVKDTSLANLHNKALAKGDMGMGKGYTTESASTPWQLSRYSPARDVGPDESLFRDEDGSRGDLGPTGGTARFIEKPEEKAKPAHRPKAGGEKKGE